jgi:hypothetical protein
VLSVQVLSPLQSALHDPLHEPVHVFLSRHENEQLPPEASHPVLVLPTQAHEALASHVHEALVHGQALPGHVSSLPPHAARDIERTAMEYSVGLIFMQLMTLLPTRLFTVPSL